MSIDRTSTNYIGLTTNWEYTKQYIDISIPLYIMKVPQNFQYTPPKHKQHAPHKCTEVVWQKIQYALTHSTLPFLYKAATTRI